MPKQKRPKADVASLNAMIDQAIDELPESIFTFTITIDVAAVQHEGHTHRALLMRANGSGDFLLSNLLMARGEELKAVLTQLSTELGTLLDLDKEGDLAVSQVPFEQSGDQRAVSLTRHRDPGRA